MTTLGEMTPAERIAAIKRAVKRVAAEMQANAPAIAKALADFDAEHAKTPATCGICGAFISPLPTTCARCGTEWVAS